MLWKALGILTMLCSSCTLMWWLWTRENLLAKVAFWVVIVAAVFCTAVTIKDKMSG